MGRSHEAVIFEIDKPEGCQAEAIRTIAERHRNPGMAGVEITYEVTIACGGRNVQFHHANESPPRHESHAKAAGEVLCEQLCIGCPNLLPQ